MTGLELKAMRREWIRSEKFRVEQKSNRAEMIESEQKGTEMNTLDLTQEKADKMSEIENMSLNTIKDALEETIDADDERVKIAVKMLSTVAKNRQTMTNRTAIEFGIAQAVATEKGLKKYVAITNPRIQKAISGK